MCGRIPYSARGTARVGRRATPNCVKISKGRGRASRLVVLEIETMKTTTRLPARVYRVLRACFKRTERTRDRSRDAFRAASSPGKVLFRAFARRIEREKLASGTDWTSFLSTEGGIASSSGHFRLSRRAVALASSRRGSRRTREPNENERNEPRALANRRSPKSSSFPEELIPCRLAWRIPGSSSGITIFRLHPRAYESRVNAAANDPRSPRNSSSPGT
jgi:hypothetical protein